MAPPVLQISLSKPRLFLLFLWAGLSTFPQKAQIQLSAQPLTPQ